MWVRQNILVPDSMYIACTWNRKRLALGNLIAECFGINMTWVYSKHHATSCTLVLLFIETRGMFSLPGLETICLTACRNYQVSTIPSNGYKYTDNNSRPFHYSISNQKTSHWKEAWVLCKVIHCAGHVYVGPIYFLYHYITPFSNCSPFRHVSISILCSLPVQLCVYVVLCVHKAIR